MKNRADQCLDSAKIPCDITCVGNYIVEDTKNGGIEPVEGVTISQARKQEMASLLKQRLLSGSYTCFEFQISPIKRLNCLTR